MRRAALFVAVTAFALDGCGEYGLVESDFIAKNGLAQLNLGYAFFECKTMPNVSRDRVIQCMENKGYVYRYRR